jgi:Arc/MetJ family transcription regulator
VSKLLVEVDDDLLAVAANKLGTTTKKATINAALAQAIDLRSEGQSSDRFRRVTRRVGRQLSETSREEMWRH